MVDTKSGQVLETLSHQASSHPSLFQLFLGAEFIVQVIMVGLVIVSILTWTVIFSKGWFLHTLKENLLKFETVFWQKNKPFSEFKDISEAPDVCVKLIEAANQEVALHQEKSYTSMNFYESRLEKTFGTFIRQEISDISKQLNFLATVGSASLFVGLFGTVWGIIHSFQSIAASKNTSLAVVAPGIAEALLATALGLIVAIPAVVAYNKLSSSINAYAGALENFADRLILSSGQRLMDEEVDAKR